MCIIVSKELGVEFPSKKVLKRCFNNNPDGAGYMFENGGKVHIRKGFMNWKAFWEDLSEIRKTVGDEAPYVMHFRISTQAGVNAQCTHPYPLSDNMNELKKLNTVADIGIAHNGIISLTSSYTAKDYNDTMKFVTDFASLIITDDKYYKDDNKIKLIERLIGASRLAIMDNSGHIEYIGYGWNTDEKGVQYSNDTWKKESGFFGSSWHYSEKGSATKKWTSYSGKKYDNYWDSAYDYYSGNYETDDDDYYMDGSKVDTRTSLDDFYDQTERAFSFIDEKYHLVPDRCPLMVYGDDGYCNDCINKGFCYYGEDLIECAKKDYYNETTEERNALIEMNNKKAN